MVGLFRAIWFDQLLRGWAENQRNKRVRGSSNTPARLSCITLLFYLPELVQRAQIVGPLSLPANPFRGLAINA
jgi:hypothetical protein